VDPISERFVRNRESKALADMGGSGKLGTIEMVFSGGTLLSYLALQLCLRASRHDAFAVCSFVTGNTLRRGGHRKLARETSARIAAQRASPSALHNGRGVTRGLPAADAGAELDERVEEIMPKTDAMGSLAGQVVEAWRVIQALTLIASRNRVVPQQTKSTGEDKRLHRFSFRGRDLPGVT